MICNKCGKTNTETATKCAFCGEALPKTTDCGGFKDILNFTPSEAPQGMPSRAQPQSDPHTKRILEHCEALSVKAKKDKIIALIAAGVAAVLFITTIVSSVISTAVITGEIKKLNSETSKDTDDKKAETTDAQTDTAKPTDTGDAVTSGTQGKPDAPGTITGAGSVESTELKVNYILITDDGIVERDEVKIKDVESLIEDKLDDKGKSSLNGHFIIDKNGNSTKEITVGCTVVVYKTNKDSLSGTAVKIAVTDGQGNAVEANENNFFEINKGEQFTITLTQVARWEIGSDNQTINVKEKEFEGADIVVDNGNGNDTYSTIIVPDNYVDNEPKTTKDGGQAICKITDNHITDNKVKVIVLDNNYRLFISGPDTFVVDTKQ